MSTTSSTSYDDQSIEIFREYLRIPSVSNKTDYDECTKFLQDQAIDIGLECTVVHLKPNRPVVIMKWPGMHPTLPSICLNSHMDVVPVEEDKWTHPPFAAHMDENGRIYGRGTQDMKCVGIQYLEAIKRLKRAGATLSRTIVLTFVPDEELGGQEGMKLFVRTKEFRELNIGFGLDESVPSNQPNSIILFYGEKHKWSVKFHLNGDVGHGSLNMPNTAAEKLARLLQVIYEFRNQEYQKADRQAACTDVVSINVTVIEGGQQENVIPSKFMVNADIRLPPNVDITEWKATLKRWCAFAGEGTRVEEVVCAKIDKPTAIDGTNPYYQPIVDTLSKLGYNVLPQICYGMTDARYLRNLGIPVFGITASTHEAKLHQHNEYIDKKQFLFGIEFYYRLLLNIGYMPDIN